MKKIILLLVLAFSVSLVAQSKQPAQQKQYKSAETGRYVTKSTATKSPSTTYSTTKTKK
jgi:hypothetical protein